MNFKRAIRNYLIKKIPVFEGCANCANRITNLSDRLTDNFHVKFPIDVVYTWVNGSEDAHYIKRLSHKSIKASADGKSMARFRNNDELRYSLRSLAEYAPWINHIYLVTDRQIPSWLNRHNKKISVIDHTDIIPHQFLPTFNSHVIEFYLHLIPNLSDHYIYFNDDFFLSAPVKPEYFFTTNGLPLIFIDWRKTRLQGYAKMQTPHAHSFFNVLNILYEKKIYISSPFIPQHGPYAQCKQNAIDAFYFFAKYINRISKNKFRTNNEIAFYSHAIPLYSSYLKKAIPCDITYYYLNIAKVDRGIYYKLLLDNKYTGQLPYYISLNDTIDKVNGNIFHSEMKDFLQKFYVYNSEFESDCIVNQ